MASRLAPSRWPVDRKKQGLSSSFFCPPNQRTPIMKKSSGVWMQGSAGIAHRRHQGSQMGNVARSQPSNSTSEVTIPDDPPHLSHQCKYRRSPIRCFVTTAGELVLASYHRQKHPAPPSCPMLRVALSVRETETALC